MMSTAHVFAYVVVYMSYERRLGWVVIRFFRYSKVKIEDRKGRKVLWIVGWRLRHNVQVWVLLYISSVGTIRYRAIKIGGASNVPYSSPQTSCFKRVIPSSIIYSCHKMSHVPLQSRHLNIHGQPMINVIVI